MHYDRYLNIQRVFIPFAHDERSRLNDIVFESSLRSAAQFISDYFAIFVQGVFVLHRSLNYVLIPTKLPRLNPFLDCTDHSVSTHTLPRHRAADQHITWGRSWVSPRQQSCPFDPPQVNSTAGHLRLLPGFRHHFSDLLRIPNLPFGCSPNEF